MAIILPTIYYSRKPSPPNASPSPPLRKPLSFLVVLHTLYVLYTLLLKYPPNLFKVLDIPLTTPSDNIRILLKRYAGGGELPPALDALLTRLSSFDARTLYVRLGQSVIESCDYCHTPSEYALHALPNPLLEYLREAAVVGLVTIQGSFRERWRKWGVGVLVATAVLEAYWILTVEIRIPRSGKGVTMWHDLFWTIRYLIFLVLVPVLHILPSRPPVPSPLASLHTVAASIEQSIYGLRLFSATHAAIMRVPETRAAQVEHFARERQEGRWAREDPDVQRRAEVLGLGYAEEEGRLRASARAAVQALQNGFSGNRT
ncbi:hypothetical protein GLOTRDRAFT_131048 [Gloeophyllum trabeum ATCC 11539]|uniref:Uncharacterized protein n=1 Tax=Gloeophyllum trabeum (strain ATCC 11539 / FP-39264 / Madison 617) TaxID=670483 RepID=S7RLX8_GLOTA|nr:uncharacterized protein GLOTRDRAFT_131048 [Gloeophyllum trabeum ATCC 11539]EPQ53709.1 hypothetical protein GLOTRDRAFT_131048 [Gloeophyllum trabeum ATCC 11539]